MLNALPADLFGAVAIGLVIGLIVLLVLQILTSMRVQKLTYPLYEYALSKAQTDAQRIVKEAQEQARTILSEAQSAATSLAKKEVAEVDARSVDYRKELDALAAKAQQLLTAEGEHARSEQAEVLQKLVKEIGAHGETLQARMADIEKELKAFLDGASARSRDMRQALEAEGKQVSGDITKAFEDVAAQGKKRIDEGIEGFLKQAQTEAEAYRENRKRLVDEHMADLVVEATKVVLRKALTPDEHADLAARALKEARTAGML